MSENLKNDFAETILRERLLRQSMAGILHSASSDIRNSVNGIMGMMETLTSQGHDPQQRQPFSVIQKCADDLLNLSDNLFDCIRMEHKERLAEKPPFKLKALIQNVTRVFESQLRMKGIQLECEFQEDLPLFVHTDPADLTQILVNLLSNAMRYTSQGKVTCRVTKDVKEKNK